MGKAKRIKETKLVSKKQLKEEIQKEINYVISHEMAQRIANYIQLSNGNAGEAIVVMDYLRNLKAI